MILIEQSLRNIVPAQPVLHAPDRQFGWWPIDLFKTMSDTADHVNSSRPGVAIIANSVPPYREHVHLRIARELPQIKLYTICTHSSQDYARWAHRPDPAINPISFGPYSGKADQPGISRISIKKGGEMVRWLAANDIKAVVVLGYNDAALLRVILYCRRRGIPCYIWGDSNVRLDHPRGLTRLIKPLLVGSILSLASGALACGRYGKAYFEKYGVPPERIFLFSNEPDYDLIFSLPTSKIEEVSQRFSLDPNRRRLVYSGRLIEVKRVDLLIDAFIRIAAQRPNWDLVIIGDGALRKDLEARVPNELASRVIWTGFLDDQPAVSALYRLCDVLVLPSDYEPWALVINEAAAAGLAMVASDVVGAAPELIREGENGQTFPRGDLAALCSALLEVTDPANIDRMKQASAAVLARWRKIADPVDGLHQALRFSNVIS